MRISPKIPLTVALSSALFASVWTLQNIKEARSLGLVRERSDASLYARSFCDQPPSAGREPLITVYIYAENFNKVFPKDSTIDLSMRPEGVSYYLLVAKEQPNTQSEIINTVEKGISNSNFRIGQTWELHARVGKDKTKPAEVFDGEPLKIGCEREG